MFGIVLPLKKKEKWVDFQQQRIITINRRTRNICIKYNHALR